MLCFGSLEKLQERNEPEAGLLLPHWEVEVTETEVNQGKVPFISLGGQRK